MGLFAHKPRAAASPEQLLNAFADVLREFGAADLAELTIVLEAIAGVEDDLILHELPEGGLQLQLGNDSYPVVFPTTRSALIYKIVSADEDALGFESTRGRQDWDLMGEFDD